MSDELRNSLWNVLDEMIWSRVGFVWKYENSGLYGRTKSSGAIKGFSRTLWSLYFKQPADARPTLPENILKEIRSRFFRFEWFEVYDFIEFVLQREKDQRLNERVNGILERELAGFRYIEGVFVPITDEQEVASVADALEGPFEGVTAHMRRAIDHLSRKQNPDYRNSIKESVSAVESLAREVTGNPKATLGDALAKIEESGHIHGALKRGFSALYGYASDEGGIRHAMLEEPSISASDAKFFLVSCSAFINYLKAKL